MSDIDPLDGILEGLQRGEDRAAEEVFRRFSHRLIGLARARLDESLTSKVDPEDVVQSVFRSFFTRYADGQFQTDDWNQIWTLLTVITVRKCRNKQLHYRAQCRDVSRERSPTAEHANLWTAISADPTPEQAAVLVETMEWLFKNASETQRAILTLHLEGWTVAEISVRLSRTERTVRRTLQEARDALRRFWR